MGRSSRSEEEEDASSSDRKKTRRRRHSRSRANQEEEFNDEPTVDLHDEDVWFEDARHPGTRDCRRAIRLVLEDFDDEEKLRFSKSVYKAILRELGSTRRFFTSAGKKRNSRYLSWRECDEDELIDHLKEVFRIEQSHRLKKIDSKSSLLERDEYQEITKTKPSSLRHTSSDENPTRKTRSPTRRRKHKKKARKSRRRNPVKDDNNDDHDDGHSTDDSQDYRRESSRNRKRPSAKRRKNKDSDDAASYKSSSEDDEARRYIFLHEIDDKATKKFRKIVRNIVAQRKSKTFPSLEFDEILDQMGASTVFFMSRSSKRELKGDKLAREIGKHYREQAHLLRARIDDIFVECPYYSGTKVWDRAIRHHMKKYDDVTLSRDVFREMRKDFRESSFFVGRPPHCEEVAKSELFQLFCERYEAERTKQARSHHTCNESDRRGGPVTDSQKLMKKRRGTERTTGKGSLSSNGQLDDTSTTPKQRPIPGNAFWIYIGKAVSARWAKWEWYHRQRKKVETLPMVVSCRKTCAPCHHKTVLPVRNCFRTDRRKGQTWCGKVAQCLLEVPYLGRAPAWFLLFALLIAFAISVFAIIYKIFRNIVDGFL